MKVRINKSGRNFLLASLVALSSCHPLATGTPFPAYDNEELRQGAFNSEKDAQQRLQQNWYQLNDGLRSGCIEANKECGNDPMYQSLLACVTSSPGANFQCHMTASQQEAAEKAAQAKAASAPRFVFDSNKKITFPKYNVNKLCTEAYSHARPGYVPNEEDEARRHYAINACIEQEQLSYNASRALWGDVSEIHRQYSVYASEQVLQRGAPFVYNALFEYLNQFRAMDASSHFHY